MNAQETQKFLSVTDDLGVMAAGVTLPVDLRALIKEYGLNFNTLTIRNNDAVEISVTLDGRKVQFISAGDAFGLDFEDGILFDDVRIKNEDGAAATVANKIRITVGRTGPNK